MAVNQVRFGPGTFTIGTTPGTDYSCQVQSMGVNVNKDEGDPITVLCGDSIPGAISYTYVLAGTFLQDLNVPDGLAEYSWANAGMEADFTFEPSTAATTSIAGKVIVDPIPLGTSDGAYGDVLVSDFEWSCIGKPAVTWPTVGTMAAQQQEQPA